MKITDLKNGSSIKVGSLLLIKGRKNKADPFTIKACKVLQLKEVEGDIEIILDTRRNVWFSYYKYLDGASWVRKCLLVEAKN